MNSPVLVIGGGWAGLAAALQLSDVGQPVTLLEGARRLGGRARSVQLGDHIVDNGQHLLLGACSAVLQVLKRAGVNESEVFLRQPFGLRMRNLNGDRVDFQAPKLPAPLHLGAALARCRGLPLATRMQAVWRARALLAADPSALTGLTVTQWLIRTRQPAALREWLWEPLCLAALNTPPSEASASLLATLLREVLAGHRSGSDLLLPRCNLDALYVDPVARQIRALGSSIELGSPVLGIETSCGRVRAVHTRTRRITCNQVILATGPSAATKLFGMAGEEKAAARAGKLEEKPITTVYIQYPGRVCLEAPFVGLVGARTQWLFDRNLPGQEGLIAGVISADTSPRDPASSKLGEQTAREVATLYPHWPKPSRIWTVRERRATFNATPASNLLRQPLSTGMEGLWVVGDYTDTGLPGTLEGAVRSGLACALSILSSSTTLRDHDAGIQTVSTAVP